MQEEWWEAPACLWQMCRSEGEVQVARSRGYQGWERQGEGAGEASHCIATWWRKTQVDEEGGTKDNNNNNKIEEVAGRVLTVSRKSGLDLYIEKCIIIFFCLFKRKLGLPKK